MPFILSGLAAVLLNLSFPKISWWPLAWVALVPFFLVLLRAKKWQAAVWPALVFGLIFFGGVFFWVTSLTRFVGWWAWSGWLCLILFQTIFIVFFSIAVKAFKKIDPLLTYPLLWALVEWLRALGPFGAPVGDLGYSQAPCPPLIQFASFLTVYGISFYIAAVNIAIAKFLLEPKKWRQLAWVFLAFLALLLYGLTAIKSPVQDRLPLMLLVQPNIDQLEKLNPAKVARVFDSHEKLSRQGPGQAQLLIWPETAVFSYLLDDQRFSAKLRKLAAEKKCWLIIGTPYYDRRLDRPFNSIVAISPRGEVASIYRKQRLVPFGEYLPFRRWLYPLLKRAGYFDSDFYQAERQEPILTVDSKKIAVAVCFESTFPEYAGEAGRLKAEWLLTLTNDGWFGDSAAPYQHLDMDILRAVEAKKYFVQVGNSGFTAVIDPFGRVVKKLPLNVRGVLAL